MHRDSQRIRVLCVDDHRLVLQGIALIIGTQPDLEVVGCATTGEEAVQLFRAHRPDVTLLDLQLPRMTGLDTIREMRKENPEARVIVVTMYQGDEDIHRALEAGAATYLLKDTLSDELVKMVREVHGGGRPMTHDMQLRLAERSAYPSLTRREIEVLDLISEGLRNKDIAVMLGISNETVQVHVKNIFAKLDVEDRTAAVHVALRRGIIHLT
jgi:DNA-binding NarL/FixJ family response regulator